MSLDNSVLGYELLAATKWELFGTSRRIQFGHSFFMRAIYLYSEIDALYDEDAVQLYGLSVALTLVRYRLRS